MEDGGVEEEKKCENYQDREFWIKIHPLSSEYLPWKGIAGTRDKLIHEYFGVDLQILWETIKNDLAPLEETILSLQKDLSE